MDALFGAFRAYLEGIFTDRVFVVSFVSNVLDRRRDRLRRRPDRRRLAAVDRRRRGARDQDLHQRRSDPAGPVPCLSRLRLQAGQVDQAGADAAEPAAGSDRCAAPSTPSRPATTEPRRYRRATGRHECGQRADQDAVCANRPGGWTHAPGLRASLCIPVAGRSSRPRSCSSSVWPGSCRSGSTPPMTTYTSARREDLIQLLDGLGRRVAAAGERDHPARADPDRASSPAPTAGASHGRRPRSEVQELSILAGTVPAEGPGIRMRIADPGQPGRMPTCCSTRWRRCATRAPR